MSNFGKKCRFVSEEEYRNSCENLISDNAVIIPAMPKENILGFLSVARGKGDWDRLLIPRHGMLLGTVGWQYFDMFPSDRDEVEFIGKGLWNKKSVMRIGSGRSSSDSSVSLEGDSKIEVTTLDSEVGEEKVTFIKMDIEGAELNALKGAKETIIKNKPRLAICIYDKPKDIYEIPEYILSLVPEYRFWIRHYTSNNWETVLYAKCL